MSGSCLFCYKSCVDEDNPRTTLPDYNAATQRRFFRLMERQVERVPRKTRGEGEGRFGSRQDDNRRRDFEDPTQTTGSLMSCELLSSCEACLKLLDSLCDTYHRMKSLELEVNWKLRRMTEVMTLADRVPTRVKRFREGLQQIAEKSGDDDERVEKTVLGVRKLREVVLKTCKGIVRLTGPRVSLNRLQSREPGNSEMRSKRRSDVNEDRDILTNPTAPAPVADNDNHVEVEFHGEGASDVEVEAFSLSNGLSQAESTDSNAFHPRKRSKVAEEDLVFPNPFDADVNHNNKLNGGEKQEPVFSQLQSPPPTDAGTTPLGKVEELKFEESFRLITDNCPPPDDFENFKDNLQFMVESEPPPSITLSPDESEGEITSENSCFTVKSPPPDASEDFSEDLEVPLDQNAGEYSMATDDPESTPEIVEEAGAPHDGECKVEIKAIAFFANKRQEDPSILDANESESEAALQEHKIIDNLEEAVEEAVIPISQRLRRRTRKMKIESPPESSEEESDSDDDRGSSSCNDSSSGTEDDGEPTSLSSIKPSNIIKAAGKKGKSRSKNASQMKPNLWPDLSFSFACSVDNCSESFMREKELEMHSKLHGQFHCDFCSVVRDYAPDLAHHERNEHGPVGLRRVTWNQKQVGKFNCPRCEFTTCSELTYVQHHLHSHLSLTPVTAICLLCDKVFFNSGNKAMLSHHLRKHIEKTHGDSSQMKGASWKCDQCDAPFRKDSMLATHKQRVHGVIMKRFKCTDCGHAFLGLRDLTEHRQQRHRMNEADFTFSCSVDGCPRRFETAKGLRGHEICCRAAATREEAKLKSCPVCGKLSEGGPLSMLTHIEYCQGKRKVQKKGPVMCEQCGKEFKAEWHLSKHMLSHTGPSSWQFSCDECGKKCMDIHKLAEHKRTHSKEKAFVCSECGSAYAHRHNWRIHMKTKHDVDLADARKGVHAKKQGST